MIAMALISMDRLAGPAARWGGGDAWWFQSSPAGVRGDRHRSGSETPRTFLPETPRRWRGAKADLTRKMIPFSPALSCGSSRRRYAILADLATKPVTAGSGHERRPQAGAAAAAVSAAGRAPRSDLRTLTGARARPRTAPRPGHWGVRQSDGGAVRGVRALPGTAPSGRHAPVRSTVVRHDVCRPVRAAVTLLAAGRASSCRASRVDEPARHHWSRHSLIQIGCRPRVRLGSPDYDDRPQNRRNRSVSRRDNSYVSTPTTW
jgi:hypothetical protein